MYHKTVAIALTILCIATSCRKEVEGSGRTSTSQRQVSFFNSIESSGTFRITVLKNTLDKITIEAEDNIIPEIETVVQGGILKLGYRNPHKPLKHGPVNITVTTPVLNHLLLRGGGEIKSPDNWTMKMAIISVSGTGTVRLNLHAEKVKAILSGPGRIELKGKASDFEQRLTGSGAIHAFGFTSDRSSVMLSGSGFSENNVTEKLEGNLTGSGILYYTGNPQSVQVAVSGRGKLVRQ